MNRMRLFFVIMLSVAFSDCCIGEEKGNEVHEGIVSSRNQEVDTRVNLDSIDYSTRGGGIKFYGGVGERGTLACKGVVDIRDLAAFSMVTYRKEIQEKMKQGDPLTGIELSFLDFTICCQIETLNTFSRCASQKILGGGKNEEKIASCIEAIPSADDKFSWRTNSILRASVETFCTNGNSLAQQIFAWAGTYSMLPLEQRVEDFKMIDSEKLINVDDVQFRQYFIYAAICPNLISVPFLMMDVSASQNLHTNQSSGVSNSVCSVKKKKYYPIWGEYLRALYGNKSDFGENEKIRVYKKYDTPPAHAKRLWASLSGSTEYYLGDCRDIFLDLDRGIKVAKDTETKLKLQEIRFREKQVLRGCIKKYKRLYYDFPFLVACAKSYISIQSCKGALVDDENKMEQVACDFLSYTCGNEMIKNLSSPTTAKYYEQLLELLKSELGKVRWKNLKTTTRFYELEEIVFNTNNESESLFKENKTTELK